MKLHPSLTADRIADAVERMHPSITFDCVYDAAERYHMSLDNPGFRVSCGSDADGCKPDMRRGKCESCGKRAVYGADEVLLRMVV
jgi:hypothetical protein